MCEPGNHMHLCHTQASHRFRPHSHRGIKSIHSELEMWGQASGGPAWPERGLLLLRFSKEVPRRQHVQREALEEPESAVGIVPPPRLLSFLDESTFVIFLHFPASPSDPLWAPLLCYPSRLGSSGGSAVVPLSLSTILIPPPLRIPCLSLISSPVFPTA